MILDGGLGVELAQRGLVFSTALWSGEAILTRPDLLVEVHRSYLAAGAQAIATATYQLSHAGLRALGHDDAAIDEIFARAVGLAREAIAAHRAETGGTGTLLVAGHPHRRMLRRRSGNDPHARSRRCGNRTAPICRSVFRAARRQGDVRRPPGNQLAWRFGS